MPNHYPPVSPKEACDIAKAHGWVEVKGPRTKGDHKYFVKDGFKDPLQIDMGESDFRHHYIKTMMKSMSVSREEFYCATKKTAKKINMKLSKVK